MSCNPAIGGLGRGHLVREIDALDGLIARAIDAGGIQFRVLTAARVPPCVGRAPRPTGGSTRAVSGICWRRCPASSCSRSRFEDLILDQGRAAGVVDQTGRMLHAGAVVLTTGTFLRGEIHLGEERWPAGRVGDRASSGLALTLQGLACGWPPEDGNPAPSRWSHDQSRRLAGPERRRSSGVVLLPDAAAAQPADRVLDHPHHGATHELIRANLPSFADVLGPDRARRACATVPPSRTRSSVSPTASATRSFSSRRASRMTPSIRTASRPRCRARCSPR